MRDKIKWVIVKLLGLWVAIDGVLSIIYYLDQSPAEHFFRVLRIAAGLLLVYLAWQKFMEKVIE